jgi:hypothetical protein
LQVPGSSHALAATVPGLVTVETVVVTVLITLAIVPAIQLTISQLGAIVRRGVPIFTVIAKVVAAFISIVTAFFDPFVIASVQSRLSQIR